MEGARARAAEARRALQAAHRRERSSASAADRLAAHNDVLLALLSAQLRPGGHAAQRSLRRSVGGARGGADGGGAHPGCGPAAALFGMVCGHKRAAVCAQRPRRLTARRAAAVGQQGCARAFLAQLVCPSRGRLLHETLRMRRQLDALKECVRLGGASQLQPRTCTRASRSRGSRARRQRRHHHCRSCRSPWWTARLPPEPASTAVATAAALAKQLQQLCRRYAL